MRTVHALTVALAAAVLSDWAGSDLQAQTTEAQEKLLAQYREAEALTAKGRVADAIRMYEQIVERAPDVFGAESKNTANMINNLAELYGRTGQYAKAVPLYQRSLKMYEAVLGKDDLAVATSLDSLGWAYFEMGEFAKVEPLHLRALRIREKKLEKDDLRIGTSLFMLARLYLETGRFDEAAPLFQRSLAISEVQLGKDHLQVASTLNSLARVYEAMGRYARAEPLFQRSLRIFEAQQGKDHPNVSSVLNNLATLYMSMGQFDKAEPLLQRCLEIREAKAGKDDVDVATNLNNLASLYLFTRQYDKAEPLYQRSLQIWEAKQGKDHPDVAHALNNLAMLYMNSGQLAKAEPLLERNLQIMESKLGPEDQRTAVALLNQGAFYRVQGEYAKAAPLCQRSLKVLEAKLGPDHPLVARVLDNLAKLEAAQGHIPAAMAAADRMRRLDRRHAARALPILAENGQLAFLQNIDRRHAQVAYSLALEGKTAEAAALSAAWVLNGKAVAQQTLAERALQVRDSRNSAAAPLVAELASVRRELTTRALAPFAVDKQDERLKEIARLTERERQLSAQLGAAAGRPVRDDPWVELAEVRRAIPRDAVLIEIVRFEVVDFKAKTATEVTKGARYVAWLIPPAEQGDVKVIDLGDAERIDRAVQAVRDGLRAAQGTAQQKSVILENGEAEAEKALRPALAALAQLVLKPLANSIDERQHWLLSPDSALWLAPWGALPQDEQTYIVEKHTLRYLASGRDLVTPASKPPAQRDASLMLANPDFDLDPKEALTLAAQLLGRAPPSADALALASADWADGRRSSGLLGKVGALEGTAREAAAVKPKLMTYAGEEPWVYRGKNALEAVVKAFHGPKVVVLSTHGFFLETQELPSDDRIAASGVSPVLTRDGKLVENPLMRCGLLLAGCNQAGRVGSGQEDGVLTGLEIAGLDLRGTELVVLSACETGLGQVRNGEGVAGLRQAFQLAGARSVVATLWQVPDNDTALLMSDFFEQLAAGTSKGEALRQAQLARIKAHRKRYGAAHPFYWAAFTITGQ